MRERKRTTTKSKRIEKPLLPVAVPVPVPAPACTPRFGIPVTVGSMDAGDWLKALDINAVDHHWFVEVALGVGDEAIVETWSGGTDTRFHIYIYPQEWGYLFCHQGRTSWIRIADRAYVHGRDDYNLVTETPPLREIASLARDLEGRHQLALRRDRALVRTNLNAIDDRVRDWVAAL
jgi:hypothetical protein